MLVLSTLILVFINGTTLWRSHPWFCFLFFCFYDVETPLFAGLLCRIVALAIAQQHEAAGHIAKGNAPLAHQLVAVVAVESLLATGDDATADAQLRGCQHHILRATEGIGNAVEEVALGKDNAHRWGSVEAALDGGVVDDAGLLHGDEIAGKTRAVKLAHVHLADGLGELRVAQSHNHTALAAARIGSVKARLDDAFQVFPGYLPLLVFADGAAMTDKFEDIHVYGFKFQVSSFRFQVSSFRFQKLVTFICASIDFVEAVCVRHSPSKLGSALTCASIAGRRRKNGACSHTPRRGIRDRTSTVRTCRISQTSRIGGKSPSGEKSKGRKAVFRKGCRPRSRTGGRPSRRRWAVW